MINDGALQVDTDSFCCPADNHFYILQLSLPIQGFDQWDNNTIVANGTHTPSLRTMIQQRSR